MATNNRIKNNKLFTDLSSSIWLDYVYHNHLISFETTWGLFSPKIVDKGSRLLLNNLTLRPRSKILDLGCGYGALGLSIAKVCGDSYVHLIDKDFVAVEYCKKNISNNKLSNAETYLSNGLSHVDKNIRFDLIISNLPAKVGNELMSIFFQEIYCALVEKGELVIVCLKRLQPLLVRLLSIKNSNFMSCDKIAHSADYVVIKAIK